MVGAVRALQPLVPWFRRVKKHRNNDIEMSKRKPKEKTTAELFSICMKNGWVNLAECFREPELELFK